MSISPYDHPSGKASLFHQDKMDDWKQKTLGTLVFYYDSENWMGYKHGIIFINGEQFHSFTHNKIPRMLWSIAEEKSRLYVTAEEIETLPIKGIPLNNSSTLSKNKEVRDSIDQSHKRNLIKKIKEYFKGNTSEQMEEFLKTDFLVFRNSNFYINLSKS